ncbi:hypothetical protein ACI65C_002949 [Semiaphis heraclei]
MAFKLRLKLKKNYSAGKTAAKFNLENLKIDEGREKYIQAVGKELSERRQHEATDNWNMVQEAIKIAAKNTIGESKNQTKPCTEQDYSQGKIRQFFQKIKRYKTFNPNLKAIRNKNNKTILIDPQEKTSRWREYFEELLNSELPELPIPEWAGHTADTRVEGVFLEETKRAINSLKDWKSPGSDGIYQQN